MATNACKLNPDAPNGKESKLFIDINKHTKNRDTAKKIWAFTQTDLFKSEFGDLEKDENGEPTYEAVARVMNLEAMFTQNEKEQNMAMDMGLLDSKGNPQSFERADVAMNKAEDFNKKASKSVAIVSKRYDGRYEVRVEDNTPLNIAEADTNVARRKLNTYLIKMVQSLGFNVEFIDDPSYYGVFDPVEAEKNATNLRTVIRIAKSEQGLDALPEEVAHFILAGMKNNAIKKRLDALMTDDMVRRILGNKYEQYRKQYENSTSMTTEERLREEAEGQLLFQLLTKKGTEEANAELQKSNGLRSILTRIWNYVKSIFSKVDSSSIDNAFIAAQNELAPVVDKVLSGDIETIFTKEELSKYDALYRISDDLESMEQAAKDGEVMLSRKLYIEQNTTNDINSSLLKKRIQRTRRDIEKKNYNSACVRILMQIDHDVKSLIEDIKKTGSFYTETTDLNVICSEAGIISRISNIIEGYIPYLEMLSQLKVLAARGDIKIDQGDADSIVKSANDLLEQLRFLQSDANRLRFTVLKQLVKLYYGDNGEKPEGFKETEDRKWESAEMILLHAHKDIGWLDTGVFSAGDSRNPLINVIHAIVVKQQAVRNNKINKYCMEMQQADADLKKAGHDNKFIYQFDKDGNPTGYYVAPIDMAKYEKERIEFVDSLDPQIYDFYEQQRLISEWEEKHTVEVRVGKPDENGNYRTERMPNPNIYKNENFQKGWTEAQKKYYGKVISLKAEMDEMLPPSQRTLYLAPQVRKSTTQMFDKDGRGALKTIWGKWRQRFAIVDDNPDYKKDIVVDINLDKKDKNKTRLHVLKDFAGRKVKRVPIYFVHKLDDPRDLCTDGTRGMFNYITMAVNFNEMNKLANAMRLMQTHVEENYQVDETDGGRKIYDFFRSLGKQHEEESRLVGIESRAGRAILKYIDRQFFNDTKEKMGSWEIGGKNVSKDALFNAVMGITSWGRMGFNVLSGITNATQGETQILCEASTNRFFNMKDFLWAKAEYAKLLWPYLGSFNSADRHDKMYLFINQFNSSEDFFKDMKEKDFNQSAMKRVMGRGNVYLCNTMGEHYLHAVGMYAVLRHERVRRVSDKKEMSLYDAIKEVHDEHGWHLELSDDIEFLDKNRSFLQSPELRGKTIIKKEDRDELFANLAIYINNINAGMHGGYSEAERGNENRQWWMRAIMQFRQWMPGMYNKLYARPYYDAVLKQDREGSYYTFFYRFLWGTIHDWKNMSLKMAIEKNNLTSEEWKNARVAMAHSMLLIALMIVCALTRGWKDDDDRGKRLLAYQLLRLKMETGALNMAFPSAFIKNVFQLIQSPAAGINSLKAIGDLFDLQYLLGGFGKSAFIQSGRFKGWYRPLKALYTLTPIYNIHKVIDMEDYNYMFNIFG